MAESENTAGVLLRVSRTTLVTVETARTLVEPGGGGDGGAGWPSVGRTVLVEEAADVPARKVLTSPTANVEGSISKSIPPDLELDGSAVNVVGHGWGGIISVGSGLGVPGEMVRVKFRRVNVDVTNMVDVKGLRVTAPVQGNVIV